MEWYLKALRQFADFEGRARRKEYWTFVLINAVISYGAGLLSTMLNLPFLAMLGGLYSIVMLIPTIAVAIRRMHDVGKSGWFVLIPLYNLILALTEGERGHNEYGPDPKDVFAEEVL